MDKVYQGLEKRITPQDAHYFYGYFDKCPWNSRGEHPVHKVPFAARQPYFGEYAELGFARDGVFEKFAQTAFTTTFVSPAARKYVTGGQELLSILYTAASLGLTVLRTK